MGNFAWIGWVIAFASLVAGFIYFRANRKVKRIDWWVDSDQDLINFPGTEIADEIMVTVDDEILEQPRAVQLTIKNTGNVSLNTGTMFREFEIACRGKQKLLTAAITRTVSRQDRTESVPVLIDPKDHMLAPGSTLLNPGDYLTCQLLVDGVRGDFELLGEAEDFEIRNMPIREYVQVQDSTRREWLLRYMSTIAALLAIMLTVSVFLRHGS